MAWFIKEKYKLKKTNKASEKATQGLWQRCSNCGEIIYNKDWEENLRVCPKCSFHYKINSRERIQLLIDEGTFEEQEHNLVSKDPLKFQDARAKYADKLEKAIEKTELNEGVVIGKGKINGIDCELCVMDFRFRGGSMGSTIGEKITRGINYALKQKLPLIIVSCSGGARMEEGILSLMQMAKTCAALARYHKAGLPYISVLTDPTTGGVTASFATIGDVIIAEPGALIGFAGPRVIEQTIKQKLPPDFQKSEFLLEHGFIDIISPRKELKNTVYKVITYLYNK